MNGKETSHMSSRAEPIPPPIYATAPSPAHLPAMSTQLQRNQRPVETLPQATPIAKPSDSPASQPIVHETVYVDGPFYYRGYKFASREEFWRRARRAWTCFSIFMVCFVLTVVGIALWINLRKKDDGPKVSQSFQIVNADGKCLSALVLADCNQNDDTQIFNTVDNKIKNKQLQGCIVRDGNVKSVNQNFESAMRYSTCEGNAYSFAKIQPGRIEEFVYCLSSKDVKFRECSTAGEYSWTQKFI
ncbi:hypothetical protein HDU97_001999 [Phlyctochytrium planicorne]|nr:hypothetical protein HDU97_001999 [Phlyctochytrium planicorne]